MGSINYLEIIAPSIFILSVISAIAFPVFYRALFAHKKRRFINVPGRELLQFERTLIYVVMTTPYLALIAYVLELPRFYTTGAILMAFYAVYYFFPSNRRMAFERRIFRVK
jgi:Trk-type K+ transport system membrane component